MNSSSRCSLVSGSRYVTCCGCSRNRCSRSSSRARGEPKRFVHSASAVQRANWASTAASRFFACSLPRTRRRRHDGIEHDCADRRGMATQVFERHARAVRNADQVELRDAQRTAHVFEVGNVRAGRIGADVDVRPEFLQAGRPSVGAPRRRPRSRAVATPHRSASRALPAGSTRPVPRWSTSITCAGAGSRETRGRRPERLRAQTGPARRPA